MAQSTAMAHLTAFAAMTLAVACSPSATAGPEPIGKVAEFTLTDQDGQGFGLEQLQGSVWVADFFFTSCPSFCPLLTRAMLELAQEFGDEPALRFLSITVDPETDTPDVLHAHATQNALPQDRWRLLTGDRAAIRELCERSFLLAFGEELGADGDILHSSRLVLVDARGRVRGYYDALDPAARLPLREAIRAVIAEAR
ncbi:MAG: SCO family protein [Planctomycetota bacterium]|nr:SCO family protein [Planctomycetota bacterium]